jgi:hypothetical protein
VDRTPPSIDVFIRHETGSEAAGDLIILSKDSTLTWEISDKYGVTRPAVVSVPGRQELQLSESSSAPINVTALDDGRYNFSITAADRAGNNATKMAQVLVDKTLPAVTLEAPEAFELRGPAKLTISALDSNLKEALLKIGDRRTVDVTGMGEYTLDTSELSDGKHTLTLIATDLAGNQGVAAADINVANVAPQLTSSAILGLVAGGAIASGAWLMILRGRRRQKADNS